HRAIRSKSAFNPSRARRVSSERSVFSASVRMAFIRAWASPGVGTSDGSRLRYTLIAQPFSARKPASSRSLVQVTAPAIACPFVPSVARFYAADPAMTLFTVGHGVRPLEELVETLTGANVRTLV